MKQVHIYTSELQRKLILLTEDEVIEWFKTNTIDWSNYGNISAK